MENLTLGGKSMFVASYAAGQQMQLEHILTEQFRDIPLLIQLH